MALSGLISSSRAMIALGSKADVRKSQLYAPHLYHRRPDRERLQPQRPLRGVRPARAFRPGPTGSELRPRGNVR